MIRYLWICIKMGNTQNKFVVNDKGIFMHDYQGSTKITKNGIAIKGDNIKFKASNTNGVFISNSKNNTYLNVTKDEFVFSDGNNKLKLDKPGIVPIGKDENALSSVCINNSCVQFECNERLNIHDRNIYCGDKLYYNYINNNYVNQRS